MGLWNYSRGQKKTSPFPNSFSSILSTEISDVCKQIQLSIDDKYKVGNQRNIDEQNTVTEHAAHLLPESKSPDIEGMQLDTARGGGRDGGDCQDHSEA